MLLVISNRMKQRYITVGRNHKVTSRYPCIKRMVMLGHNMHPPIDNDITTSDLDCKRECNYTTSTICRTNVLGDYIEKLASDVHILSLQYETDDDGDNDGIGVQLACIHACIIIAIMIYIGFNKDDR